MMAVGTVRLNRREEPVALKTKTKQEHRLAGADRSSIFLFKGVGTYLNFNHKGWRGGVERGV
ncbi:hypothetical protein DPMN_098042 [Dreissena polymorpha]|uniref:Uncharacterized protein n=1 Tax=Dreissena polymorpha TaxID=45954 RepID=A0A9D4LCA3_DREPO|nr:hypothetical protein DPMN_098042 [Dreissena polymorpha]